MFIASAPGRLEMKLKSWKAFSPLSFKSGEKDRMEKKNESKLKRVSQRILYVVMSVQKNLLLNLMLNVFLNNVITP